MKRLFSYLCMVLCLGLMFNASVMAETKWITKNNSTTSKVKTIEQLYVEGLLTRSECIKIKERILKGQSVPGCKITETKEETVTYITKKKEGKYITKKEEGKYITKKKEGKYITKKESKKTNTKILLLIPLLLLL